MIIVVKGLPALAAALRSGYFQRAGVQLKVVTSATELLRETRFGTSDLVVVPGTPGPDSAARQLAVRLRSAVRDGRPVLVLALPPAGLPIAEDLSLFDRVVPLASAERDVMRLIRPLLPTARGTARQRSRLPVRLFARNLPTFDGEAVDLSIEGVGLVAERALDKTSRLSLLFHRPDGRSALVSARLAWHAESAPHRAGFSIVADVEAIRALVELAAWDLTEEDGREVLRLYGALTAASPLAGARASVHRVAVFDLSEVAEVRPEGVRRFFELLESVARMRPVRLRGVPAPIAQALAARSDLGHILVESFESLRTCTHCQIEFLEWMELDRAPPPDCPLCAMPIARARRARVYPLRRYSAKL